MQTAEIDVVFFDLGDTLGVAELSAPPVHLVGFHVFPFVTSVVQNCRDRGARLGIISNTGDDVGTTVDAVLLNAGIVGFFDQPLRIYSADVGIRKDDPALFRMAVSRAGLADTPARCLFVGEDSHERSVALSAGLRVCPHPLLVSEIMAGQQTRFVRISHPPISKEQPNWLTPLRDRAVVPLHFHEGETRQLYAITSERIRLDLGNMGYRVETVGEPDLPLTNELFIFHDDLAKESGFLSTRGQSQEFFSSADDSKLLLSSERGELLVGLPANRSLSQFHFEHTRHGHTFKLSPNPFLLESPVDAHETYDFLADRARFVSDLLTNDELKELGRLDESAVTSRVDRYSGKQPLNDKSPLAIISRHIAHDHNALAVAQLAADFQAVGQGLLEIRLHKFSHLGKALLNVEATLAGKSKAVVLVTAHLDSTAASSPNYKEITDPAPGADDDASGMAAVVAIAERLVALALLEKPQKTIRFVLFNAEEEGLVGSQAYARLQKSLGTQIVGVFQMDMVGYNRAPPRTWEVHAGFFGSASVESQSVALALLLQNLCSKVAPSLPHPQIYSTATSPGGDPAAGRSDHGPFQSQGYPACCSSEDFFVGPGPTAPEREENPNYHKREDTYIDGLFAADIARVIGSAAWCLSKTAAAFHQESYRKDYQKDIMSSQRELDSRKVGNQLRGAFVKAPAAGSKGRTFFGLDLGTTLTGAVTRVNTLTNAPASVEPSGEVVDGKSLIDRALAFVSRKGTSMGFSTSQIPEFAADPIAQRTSSGAAAVHLKQEFRGVPVFQMTRTVRFDSDGAIIDAPGDNASIDPTFSTVPILDVKAAVLAAAQHLANTADGPGEKDQFGQVFRLPSIVVDDFRPTVLSEFSLPSRPTVLEKGPFDRPIPANLIVFQQPQRTRLGWQVLLTFPDAMDQFFIIVSADRDTGEVLYAKSTLHKARARGKVFEFSPGVGGARQIDFPRPIGDYPAMPSTPLINFPADWVDTDTCQGNSTRATLGATNQTLTGVLQGALVDFSPQNNTGDDQKVLNIFYFCNYMHDFLYILGFDEVAGNFQQVNFTHTGRAGDPVMAQAHAGAIYGTANMLARRDGQPPVMNMGALGNRHTAFDADVVFHEYTHGLTNRLVGGPMDDDSLFKFQSSGMGEGWSDFFALTIQNYFRPQEKTVTGDWVANRTQGIRSAPYDDHYPLSYGDISTMTDEHDVGEVWCAALMMAVRRIRLALGADKDGYRLGWQIVVDGLKLVPANATFLEARDGILMALDHLKAGNKISAPVHQLVRKSAWQAFAHFGMGVGASSGDADDVSSIVPDNTLPTNI